MLPNQPIYTMGRKSKRKFSPCCKCGFPVRPGKKYTVDPIDTTKVFHAECYKQQYKKIGE